MNVPANHVVTFSAGKAANLGACVTKTCTWAEFKQRLLAKPKPSGETMAEFRAMAKGEQSRLKKANWFVGGAAIDGRRTAASFPTRALLTVDIDQATDVLLADLQHGTGPLAELEYAGHTTRSSTLQTPRLHLVIPLAEPITAEEHTAVVKGLSRLIQEYYDGVVVDTAASADVARLFYGPTLCADAPHTPIGNLGSFLDCKALAARYRDDAGHDTARTGSPRRDQSIDDETARLDENWRSIMEAAGAIIVESLNRRGEFATNCPWHDDNNPSLDITQDGKMVCRAGCKADDGKEITWARYVAKKLGCDIAGAFAFAREVTGIRKSRTAPPKGESESNAQDANWMSGLEWKRDGIKPTLTNIVSILANDAEFTIERDAERKNATAISLVERNAFTNEMVTRARDAINGDLWTDRHDSFLRFSIEKKYKVSISARNLLDAINVHGENHSFHPVRDYLTSLVWDGIKRVSRLFVDYLGAPDDEYHTEAAELTCLGAITRITEPGHKFDFVPILEGAQGKRKSTFISILAKGWFTTLDGDFSRRKAMVEKMQGVWILELPELSSLSRSDILIVKDFISTAADKERLAYGKRAADFRRQSIMIGSTNDAEYLRDLTGNRRFWPIKCLVEEIDTDKLLKNVDQIWAEALVIYKATRKRTPEGTLDLSLKSEQARAMALTFQTSRRQEGLADIWAGKIEEWLVTTGLDETCSIQAWTEGLKYEGRPTGSDVRTLNDALRCIPGWTFPDGMPQRRFDAYGKQRVFARITTGGVR